MSASAPQLSFSEDEVAQHNGVGDLWVIIDGEVYDLSDFMDEHPGGPKCMHLTFLYEDPFTDFFSSFKRGRKRRHQEVPKISPRQYPQQV